MSELLFEGAHLIEVVLMPNPGNKAAANILELVPRLVKNFSFLPLCRINGQDHRPASQFGRKAMATKYPGDRS
jgi:hypothetical protein